MIGRKKGTCGELSKSTQILLSAVVPLGDLSGPAARNSLSTFSEGMFSSFSEGGSGEPDGMHRVSPPSSCSSPIRFQLGGLVRHSLVSCFARKVQNHPHHPRLLLSGELRV